jgi:NADH-quinone oxidoreductase subunit C
MEALRDRREFRFDLLVGVTAVDYIDHFEAVYHLLSLPRNARAVIKVRCGEGRTEPSLPSVTPVWRGADLQEREVWDLLGVRFESHPNHKRIMLWEGFPGHPLRKDFITYDQSVVPPEAQGLRAARAGHEGGAES